MKKFGVLAVMALLLMFGCSKDDLITTEQDLISVEENSQPIVNGNKQGLVNAKFGKISFFSTSLKNSGFIKEWTQEAEDPYPNLKLDRKLLHGGKFSGNLSGFGKINSTLNSTYTFTFCEPLPIDSPPNYGERLMYNFLAKGEIYLNTSDHCSITITGNLYPWYYADIQFDGGLVIGTATTHDGVGKLKNFNKTFWIWRRGMDRRGINLTTGEISLDIME